MNLDEYIIHPIDWINILYEMSTNKNFDSSHDNYEMDLVKRYCAGKLTNDVVSRKQLIDRYVVKKSKFTNVLPYRTFSSCLLEHLIKTHGLDYDKVGMTGDELFSSYRQRILDVDGISFIGISYDKLSFMGIHAKSMFEFSFGYIYTKENMDFEELFEHEVELIKEYSYMGDDEI